MSESSWYAIGLISSVSGDRVDAAIIQTDGRDATRPVGGVSLPCEESLYWGLLEATQDDLPTTEILRLEKELTEHFGRAVELLRERHPEETASARAIGLDGHTLRRMPREGLSLQLGDPWRLSEITGLPVISDFRRHDMALGGEGAPLEAMYHWSLMATEPRPALMLNLGSVTSLTWLSRSNDIIAGDVGPGMEMLDEWVQEVAEAESDHEGQVSTGGEINEDCVRYALESPFFERPLPKAATRPDFERIDVSGLGAQDGAATLCAVIAQSVVAAVEGLPEKPGLLWVTGSGSRNPLILSLLGEAFEEIKNVGKRELNPDTLEAECYAWLAIRYLEGLPVSTPETTGCRAALSGGMCTAANPVA